MFNRKLLLLLTVSLGLFQNVSPSPLSLKNTIRHIKCGLHIIKTGFFSHDHKYRDPCKMLQSGYPDMIISDGQDITQQISASPTGDISESILTSSGFETVHANTNYLQTSSSGIMFPNEIATPIYENNDDDDGKTWMFKKRCKKGEIATAYGCKNLALIKAGLRPEDIQK